MTDYADSRDETEDEKLTRNLAELLQELRVVQTGVQLLTGLLLTLPFTDRFKDLDSLQRNVYLATLSGSVITTGLVVAPVALHRILFRKGERRWIVAASARLARGGMVTLALTTTGVVWLVFDVVTTRLGAGIAAGTALAFFAALWGALPLLRARFEASR